MLKGNNIASLPAISRRRLLGAAGAGAAFAALPSRLFAQEALKVAAIYTVPVEQQWVSRIHKAANAARDRGDIEYVFSENTSNNDYERVMREYAEAGNKLVVGERWHPAVVPASEPDLVPWARPDTLVGVELVEARAYYAQFDVDEDPQARRGLRLEKTECGSGS